MIQPDEIHPKNSDNFSNNTDRKYRIRQSSLLLNSELEDSKKYKTSNPRKFTVYLPTKSNILPQKSKLKNSINKMNKYEQSDYLKNIFKFQADILNDPFLKTEAMNKNIAIKK